MAETAELLDAPASFGTKPLAWRGTKRQHHLGPCPFRLLRPLSEKSAGIRFLWTIGVLRSPFKAGNVFRLQFRITAAGCGQLGPFRVASAWEQSIRKVTLVATAGITVATYPIAGLCIPSVGGSGSHATVLILIFFLGRILG